VISRFVCGPFYDLESRVFVLGLKSRVLVDIPALAYTVQADVDNKLSKL